ncbi:hypothetical protein BTHE68_13990 [Burkholderia sp. THE68]|uniref:hypothetical protein n=1 Tax=Burkholderia sp. THE68 TaxID=758782 RepID=UPI001317C420|nr:hypothetical protein [Burkholderia sp. THE68]BBU27665.1 hypothetical protein BTHE68_13990 [Burkholderia sp. THE68]
MAVDHDVVRSRGAPNPIHAEARAAHGVVRWVLLASVIIAALVALYAYANLPAPVQRDGAHFVFMANNIAHGQAPYWASFETKNPLVEIYWSPILLLLAHKLGLAGAARVAEALWIGATGLLLFGVIVSVSRDRAEKISAGARSRSFVLAGFAAASLYVVLASDVRATDDGLNIALYQALPELALLAALTRMPERHWFAHGLLIGMLVFLAWFVKQTSILPAALLIVCWMAIVRRRSLLPWALGAGCAAALCLGGFALHLMLTGTLHNYLFSTMYYRAGLSTSLVTDFLTNAQRSFLIPLWKLNLAQFLSAHRVWTAIAMIAMVPWAFSWLFRTREQGWTRRRIALTLGVAWMVGAWLQAVLALTFFPHYFLACLAPVAFTMGLLLASSSPHVSLSGSAVSIILAAGLVFTYSGMRAENELKSQRAPINQSTREVMQYIKPQDKVFSWSCLPHVLLAHEAPSAYPLNMCWPYIAVALSESTRMQMLARTLSTPPDVVVAMQEQLSVIEGMKNFAMSEALLEQLTGQHYVLVHTTAPIPGRYGSPVSVFRRQ